MDLQYTAALNLNIIVCIICNGMITRVTSSFQVEGFFAASSFLISLPEDGTFAGYYVYSTRDMISLRTRCSRDVNLHTQIHVRRS